MGPELELKALATADLPFAQAVFESVLPLYRELMPGAFEENLKIVALLIENRLDFSATGLNAELIQVNGQAQGFLAWARLEKGPAYLASLHFLPVARRQGWGGRALVLLENQLKRQGLPALYLLAHAQADWALDFYLKQGYARLAEAPEDILRLAGTQIEHLLMPGMVLMGKEWS